MAFSMNLGSLWIHLRADITNFSKAMYNVETTMNRVANRMIYIGKSLMLRVTLPLTAFGVASARAFGNFDDAMTQSLAIMGDMSDEMKIKPRILGLLISYQPQAFLSQKLATIHRDVPIGFSLEDCRWGEYDKEKLQKLFEELGFLSLLRRFDKSSKTDESKSKKDEDQKAEIGKNDEQLKLL